MGIDTSIHHEALSSANAQIRADGSGNVSTEELINTVRALNLEAQAGQILAIVSNAGHSGDIDFGAFLDIFGFGGDNNS